MPKVPKEAEGMESSHLHRAGDWNLLNYSYPTSELDLVTGPQVHLQREVKVGAVTVAMVGVR